MWPVSLMYDWQICITLRLLVYLETVIQTDGKFICNLNTYAIFYFKCICIMLVLEVMKRAHIICWLCWLEIFKYAPIFKLNNSQAQFDYNGPTLILPTKPETQWMLNAIHVHGAQVQLLLHEILLIKVCWAKHWGRSRFPEQLAKAAVWPLPRILVIH